MKSPLQFNGQCQKMSGPGGATNATPGPDHRRSEKETATMADACQFSDFGEQSNRSQIAILSADDLARCHEINARVRDRVRAIALAVSAETAVPISSIYGRGRTAMVVQARDLVMYIARKQGMTLQSIGEALNRDHTTIKHGIQAEEKRRGER